MYIKICGLQTPQTVAAAVAAGTNAVGFIFAPGSVRTVTAELVANLVTAVPAGIESVAVFRNQPLREVIDMATRAGVSTVQLHGDEPWTDIARLRAEGFQTLRAFSVQAYQALSVQEKLAWAEERILLDAVEPGSGVPFDAGLLARDAPQGFWLLAGGLTPENVAELAAAARPDGVDVSSGVESSRGVKDDRRIAAFTAAARSCGPATQ